MQSAKSPEECGNLIDIRQGIDAIDHEIIKLLHQRMDYVLSASHFKPSEQSISAPDRVAAMLIERRIWAEQEGLPADCIELLFSEIIQWFINQQKRYWRAKHGLGREEV